MDGCPNSLQLDHEGRICTLEANDKEQDKKIDRLDDIREAIVGINANLTFQQKESEKMNTFLMQLEKTLNALIRKNETIENKVNDLDVKVENLSKSDNKNYWKIDKRTLIKKCFKWIVYVAGGLGTIFGLLKLFNIF